MIYYVVRSELEDGYGARSNETYLLFIVIITLLSIWDICEMSVSFITSG